jgi:preprotein translocase subunit Sec61beta
MKKLIISYVDENEFEKLKERYSKKYFESKKYKKLKLSPVREIRIIKNQ